MGLLWVEMEDAPVAMELEVEVVCDPNDEESQPLIDKSSDSILSKSTLPLSVDSGATDIIQNSTDDDNMDEEGSDKGG